MFLKNMIKAVNLTKTYFQGKADVAAFKKVNLEIFRKEAVLITGPSGAGKSTLLHLLGGLDRPTKGAILYLFMAGMMFPVFLGLVPLFFLLQSLKMLNTYVGLMFVYIAYSLPFTIFFLTGFFKTLPSELHESAVIDGANQYRIFFAIMLPLAQPGLVTVGIFNVLGMWNQFILPLVLMSDSEKYMLTQGLNYMYHQQYYMNDWSALFAAVVLIMAPTLLVYALFQNQIQKGLTVGALKG